MKEVEQLEREDIISSCKRCSYQVYCPSYPYICHVHFPSSTLYHILHYWLHSQLWGEEEGRGNDRHKKICQKALFQPKSKGEIGVWVIESFNLVLLYNQGWRILKNPSSLLSRVITTLEIVSRKQHQNIILLMYGEASLLHDLTFCRGLDGELVTDILLRFGRINGN